MAEDERPIFELFARWVGAHGAVLYLPIASEHAGESYLAWISAALNPLGVNRIEMWTDLAHRASTEIERYDAIFIGGGNTWNLLQQLQTTGFDDAIKDFARRGGVIYGGSAGAIVLGWDIATCAYLDENTVGLVDTSGLDLLDGDSVWCHYKPTDNPLVRSYVQRSGSPTITLTETTGIWVRGHRDYVPLGCGNVYRFTLKGRQVVPNPK